MKKLFNAVSILAIFIMLGIFAIPEAVNAQTDFESKAADLTHFTAIFPNTLVDSASGIVYSEWFTLAGYQIDIPYLTQVDTSTGLVTTFNEPPLRYTYIQSSSSGKPHLLHTLQGTNNKADANALYTVDTLSAANDSLETRQKNNAVTFNGNKFMWYRVKIAGLTGNRADTYAKFEIYYARTKNN